MDHMKSYTFRIIALALLLAVVPACETGRQTGALTGAGIGGIVGGAAGGWKWAAIGAAAGAAGGYIIGNESDRAAAKNYSSVPENELQPLAGTRWELTNVVSDMPRKYQAFAAEFRPDGTLMTNATLMDGTQKSDQERYRIVGDILIVNKPDYVLNFNWQLDGDTLTVSGIGEDRVHLVATFRRTG
jgi:hypothetical protein